MTSWDMADRERFRERVHVRPRFKCLVCLRFLVGTDHGTCPQCGWKPPTITPHPPVGRVERGPAVFIVLGVLAALAGWLSVT